MDIFSNIALGFSVAFGLNNIFYCLVGTLIGTAIGVLPGLGPLATMAMLLPFTFGLEPTAALIMLAGMYYGSQYGGSTTAILINLPGESSSAVTTIDGHPMVKQGRAGPALFAAGVGSFIAGSFATFLIALVAVPLTDVALSFGPAEYFSLMVLGLVLSTALASGSAVKAICMICLGLLLGLIGLDPNTGVARFTMGAPELYEGIDIVSLAVGLFGISEILKNLENPEVRGSSAPISKLWPTREDLRRMFAPIARGTFIGSFLGVLPGGGALLSSFVAYALEKRVSRYRSQLGKGAIEGVAAPEAANNAGAQTSFIPMLSLGIPGNATMAIMIGAMMMQGISPGPTVIVRNPDLFWGLIASMWIGNAMLVILNVPLIGIWVALLRIPYSVMFPAIIVICCIGAYSVQNTVFSSYIILLAGLLGYLLIKLECELPPLILGFILGPMLEVHLRRALIISEGDPSVFVTRPISAVLLCLAVVALIVASLPSISRKRQEVFVEEE
ncbi:tripartite tricarboxylate transporter permease [Ancylobacter polymorphus]|uniref:Tripartite tricarboxylate transporter permease n=1 Tax=Ancylobacter polymorphus TaxID=223390 RepID=A0A9E7D7C5_9HYPH|nr:tripartite tricarboxylate transporter permease [Ancylobacter polymorphus]UOK73325.1 tripartite tricarboxylate transporter permease [Ancylobacter polymorphus]